jgi:hypothetical protein
MQCIVPQKDVCWYGTLNSHILEPLEHQASSPQLLYWRVAAFNNQGVPVL